MKPESSDCAGIATPTDLPAAYARLDRTYAELLRDSAALERSAQIHAMFGMIVAVPFVIAAVVVMLATAVWPDATVGDVVNAARQALAALAH